MKSKITKNALVIGLGSVGTRHVQAAKGLNFKVTGVDVKSSASFGELSNEIEIFDSLDKIKVHDFEYVVIANWGPDHFSTLEQAIDMNLSNKFLIEKPLVTSLSAASKILSFARSGKAQFINSATLHYRGADDLVTKLVESPITSIVVSGGAQCMSTTGYHWLDFACRVFDGLPESVFSDLRSSPINPRSEHLDFIEGTASWVFTGGKRLSMSFDNSSSISSSANLYSRNEKVEITATGAVRHFRRNDSLLAEDPRVTRTQMPELVKDYKPQVDVTEAFSKMHHRLVYNSPSIQEMEREVGVSQWLILAMESNKSGERIKHSDVTKFVASNNQWKIS